MSRFDFNASKMTGDRKIGKAQAKLFFSSLNI